MQQFSDYFDWIDTRLQDKPAIPQIVQSPININFKQINKEPSGSNTQIEQEESSQFKQKVKRKSFSIMALRNKQLQPIEINPLKALKPVDSRAKSVHYRPLSRPEIASKPPARK